MTMRRRALHSGASQVSGMVPEPVPEVPPGGAEAPKSPDAAEGPAVSCERSHPPAQATTVMARNIRDKPIASRGYPRRSRSSTHRAESHRSAASNKEL